MSDLRFAHELGTEFERIERARPPAARARHVVPAWTAKQTGRILIAAAIIAPIALAVVATRLISHPREGAHQATSSSAPHAGLALSGGNCRRPARKVAIPGGGFPQTGPDGMIRAASGRVVGTPWQLRVAPGTEQRSGTEHGVLRLGGTRYGLCSQRAVPIPFGLINVGTHGVVYGYVANGAGSYRVTVSADSTTLASTAGDSLFFILALPRAACSYPVLTVTASAGGVRGLPPDIRRSLNDAATRFTTTTRFGACRPGSAVTAISASGQTSGRNPNAPLAHVTAQLKLIAPANSHSDARGTLWELSHDGKLGVNVLAVGLSPGRYGLWLVGLHHRATKLGAATVKHELQGSYDLPVDVGGARHIVLTTEAPGQVASPGTTVLSATLP